MKAVTYFKPLPIDHDDSLIDVTLERPTPGSRDLLVEVRAISVNPVDAKIRAGGGPGAPGGPEKILGWDAAGVVAAVGSGVTLFAPGDEVYYAGAIDRSGSYAESQLVDERIVGRKPASIGFSEAAALPLTRITAWELLFDRLKIRIGKPADAGSLLVLGGAGGVGSIATQVARRMTGLTVIATASRPETQAWSPARWCPPCDRPSPADRRAGKGDHARRRHLRAGTDPYRGLFRPDRRGTGSAGRTRPYRESGLAAGHHQAEAPKHLAPLGIHVYARVTRPLTFASRGDC